MSMPPPSGPPAHQSPPPPPYPQPNTYGPPYPQPNAYGPGPAQSPYPQPNTYGPGPAQSPYYPPQGGWGGPPPPPMPPPPKKNRTGLTLGIVAASIAGVLALSWIGNGGLRGSSGSGAYPAATHRLALPKTLLDGRYTLADDRSGQADAGLDNASEAVIRDPKGVMGQYTTAGEAGAGVLVVSGLYGRIKDPDLAREKILKGAREAAGTSVLVPPKDVTPSGANTTVTCQVLATEQSGGGRVTYPMCAWADENTNAAVAEMTTESAGLSPESVDLTKAAQTTLKVREETRRPLG
ncbi:hypothetical protein ACF06X_32230 [Streptomyces sp. NPDC015346]|uniref:hypothetical protein n=1 Tax=Streptomyces sp. NPDC015346 TaxID=3364954 RepID=UPI003700A59A